MNPAAADLKFPSTVTPSSDIPGLTPEQSRILHHWLADAHGISSERITYVVVVEIAEGKYRRRPYLSLSGAQAAVERAAARGVAARVSLCELRPLVGGL